MACFSLPARSTYLKSREDVAWVNYPGLEGDKYFELAKKYMPNGTCGVISFGLQDEELLYGSQQREFQWNRQNG